MGMCESDYVERLLYEALNASPDAAGLFNWLTASHREVFLEWILAGEDVERALRIETIVTYLSGTSNIH